MDALRYQQLQKAFNHDKDSVRIAKASVGKTIKSIQIDGEAIIFEFNDHPTIKIYDDGGEWEESRYMLTDDDLNDFIGAQLLAFEVRDATSQWDDEADVEHDIQFMCVRTTKGQFDVSSHV